MQREFPKWLYRGDRVQPDSLLVPDQTAQDDAIQDGWRTAELFYVEPPSGPEPKKKKK